MLYMHAATLLEILDCLSSVEVSISHVSVALASSKYASIIVFAIIDCSVLMD